MEPFLSKLGSDMPFRYMESEHGIRKTSNAAGHPGLLTRTPIQLHLSLLRKAAPGMARPRLLRHTLVDVMVEVGMHRIIIQSPGKLQSLSYVPALSSTHANLLWNLI